MLRFVLMTPADTAALDAHVRPGAIDAARVTRARVRAAADVPARTERLGVNQNHPRNAIRGMESVPGPWSTVSSAPTTRGPMTFAKVRIQITAAVANTLAGGALIPGMSSAR